MIQETRGKFWGEFTRKNVPAKEDTILEFKMHFFVIVFMLMNFLLFSSPDLCFPICFLVNLFTVHLHSFSKSLSNIH